MGLFSWLFGTPRPQYRRSRSSGCHNRFEGAPAPVAHLPGPGTYAIDVVGESKYQGALAKICCGRTEDSQNLVVSATLVPEDDNSHDGQAVRVDIRGMTVGYLSRKNARQYRLRLKEAGHPGITATCSAVIVGGWDRGPDDQGYYGVRLDLPTGDE
jgi:hypothetical protein